MAGKRFLLLLAGCVLLGLIKAQDEGTTATGEDGCPLPDPEIECAPPDSLNNECMTNEDCTVEGEKCCSDGCEMKCVAAAVMREPTPTCTSPVDLGFIIDASGSIGDDNFRKILAFIAMIVDAFSIGPEGTHIGAILYSDDAVVQFDFNTLQGAQLTRDNVVKEINKMKVTDGKTRIDLALELAHEKLFSAAGGVRSDKPKIALVMTDGRQTKGEDAPDATPLHIASRPLKESGVQVYSLGIGRNYDIGELLDIASDDASVFRSSDVDELVSIVASISEQTCKGCTRPLDINFALDSSINVGPDNFEMMKNFIKAVGDKFIISETGSHMSASVFGDDAALVFNMSKGVTQDDFVLAADDIPYLGDSRGSMDNALELAGDEIFTLNGYARQNVAKVLVLLTASNCLDCDKKLTEAVKPLRAAGVQVVTIPIGSNANIDEMKSITSLPTNKFLIPQSNFADLMNGVFVQQVSQMICTGRPGKCPIIEDPNLCESIETTCDFDVTCPTGEKCCLGGCKLSCSKPKAACVSKMELAFAFETTRQGESTFNDMKKMAANLMDHFKIGAEETHVSLSTFSDSPVLVTDFMTQYNKDLLKEDIMALKSDRGDESNIANLLQFADKEIFTVSSRLRQSQPRTLVIFTDGNYPQSQAYEAKVAASRLKADGRDIRIVAINVGDKNNQNSQEILESIVSQPTSSKLINLDVSELSEPSAARSVSEEICSSKTRIKKCKEVPQLPLCSVRDNLCDTDYDCPGYEECMFDGCRRRCRYCGESCDDKMDILVIMEDSARAGEQKFQDTKRVVKELIPLFDVSQAGTNIALMTYSDKAVLHRSLPVLGSGTPKQSAAEVSVAIDNIPFSGGASSNLDRALGLAAAQVFPENSKSRQAKKVVIIFTDGNDDSKADLKLASWPLRKQRYMDGTGTEVNAVRIMAATTSSEIRLDVLEKVVSPELEDNVFVAADMDDMVNSFRRMATESCKSSSAEVPPPLAYQKGDPGPKGKPGKDGDKGDDGDPGDKGKPGGQGDPGDPGKKGQKGEKGLIGPPGKSIGSTGDTKGPDPEIGAVGVSEILGEAIPGPGNIIYDLRPGPDGPPGKIGKPGPVGPPGPRGKPGNPGRQGSIGLTGDFGPAGNKGVPGNDGNPGISGEPGKAGKPGKQGPMGSPGFPGQQGPFGYKGEQGTAGSLGDAGDAGLKGAKGYVGEKGDQGELGAVGFPGPDGPTGPIGPPGNRGVRGEDGPAGEGGDTGPIGLPGQMGPRGNQGSKGQPGLQGVPGPKGLIGDAGPIGEQGSQGLRGPQGISGKNGKPGVDGPMGLPGATGMGGPQGPRGKRGPGGSIGAVGPNGPKGANGEQGRRGSVGEKGENGEIGAPGPKGPTGAQGRQGKTGSPGPRGASGGTGAPGLQGPAGDPGRQGQVGAKGNNGLAGMKGAVGDKGSDGLSGRTGAKGFPGDAGSIGMPGLPGRPGKTGRPGNTGKDGESGAPGLNGIQGIPGNIGLPGPSGDAGDNGDNGLEGRKGGKGAMGTPGIRGERGPTGRSGKLGLRGERGEQGSSGMAGRQGPAGARGPTGENGPDGNKGAKGSAGRPGDPGLVGPQGAAGPIGVTGPPGAQGRTGEPGDPGANGLPGDQGIPGMRGRSGFPGKRGLPGLMGSQGASGQKGKAGPPGKTGEKGMDGTPGPKGPEGASGPPGLPGPRGAPGLDGQAGIDGSDGQAGEIGQVGKPGRPGIPGPPGLRGPTGAPGLKGPKGQSGKRGEDGVTGPVGEPGEHGDEGIAGSIGERGIDGDPGTDGEPGPQGVPGSQGPSGALGPDGPIGPDGNPGNNGLKGPIGDPGSPGAAGEPGEVGASGKNGVPGKPGSNGKEGPNGIEGSPGPRGSPGEQGPPGMQGRMGALGKPGQKGYRGADGSSGLSGKRGQRGEQGPAGDQGPTGTDGRPGKNGLDGVNGNDGKAGRKGDPGDRGDVGPYGPVGKPGEDGEAGAKGSKGPNGPSGATGASGKPGTRGPKGPKGSGGNAGKSGEAGRAGSKGYKGQMGRYGLQGPPGPGGEKGDVGPAGPTGQTGPQGSSGEPGPDGAIGPPGPKGPTGNGGQIGHEGPAGPSGDNGIPGSAGEPGPAGPPGPPGDMSGLLTGPMWDRFNGGQKGPRWYRKRRSLDEPTKDKEEVEALISRNYNLFKNFTDMWTMITNKFVVLEGLGGPLEPAPSCADLFRMKPAKKSGDYWIDPNGGSPHDAVLVHCNATNYETCIYPKNEKLGNGNHHDGKDGFLWAFKDILEDSVGIEYAASIPQLKMIRLLSERCRQNITYHCKNSNSHIRIKTDRDEVKDIQKLNLNVIRDDCKIKDNKWRRSVYEIDTDDLELLPVQDIAAKDIGDDGEEFGIEFGPICFS